ncbi:VTT domain-containing protein [Fructobacillus sp. M1-13]|uniref:Cytochrome O ubiquinol oxidase n=1 Tax=Fructobacillus papyriferae TaxID=2713171 RepID=A0ABS5QN66_9LACO|nr:VTT domain-containing protein [Fructobacillus papyriferae]MBS9334533.1 cytochrome O ubiquinol oxidase [Fructobacillus papyriferae]MCD2158522.1 VTT domain-containing protein [Fructobacillus papyriferae]
MSFLINFILHIDDHIASLVQHFGPWTYLILFAIILVETGAIVLPFLPGDSLLFAAGAISMTPAGQQAGLNHWVFMIVFFIAAVVGDITNYLIARKGGRPLLEKKPFSVLIKPKNIEEAEQFFQKHGGVAVIMGRYVPIIRTFVPFVAGLSAFSSRRFIEYVLIAAFSWSFLMTGAGALFGNIPFVAEHFSAIILGIVFVTLLPSIIALSKSLLAKKK